MLQLAQTVYSLSIDSAGERACESDLARQPIRRRPFDIRYLLVTVKSEH
jgi:hypothetical protein